jgi:hypothetical protein
MKMIEIKLTSLNWDRLLRKGIREQFPTRYAVRYLPRRSSSPPAVSNETPADRLQAAVEELARNVRVLTDVVDEIREDLSWLTRNGMPTSGSERQCKPVFNPERDIDCLYRLGNKGVSGSEPISFSQSTHNPIVLFQRGFDVPCDTCRSGTAGVSRLRRCDRLHRHLSGEGSCRSLPFGFRVMDE